MFQADEAGWQRFVCGPEDGAGSSFASPHAGRAVLITGAGGSIGSALALALAEAGLKRLVLLDSSETALLTLRKQFDRSAPVEAVLGTFDDPGLLDSLFRRRGINLVYHAAAHKDVPLLETRPFAAVQNNGVASHTLARACLRGRVANLVLISTDKAVNPHSIMGASKRIAELALMSLSNPSCRMNAIRLCNVIGSSGSVVPRFQQQIAERQPVTVTDPQASRWFLTMREAVEAILACGVFPGHGSIVLAPAGRPIRIAELARFLIHSAGGEGDLVYTGLRPGDKLTEELTYSYERTAGSHGPLTVIETSRLRTAELGAWMKELSARLRLGDLPGLLQAIQSVIPEYMPGVLLRERPEGLAAHA